MAYTVLRSEQTKKVRGVLFDMDGVILDTEKLYCRFWTVACEEFGFSMTYEQSLSMRGRSRNAQEEVLVSLAGHPVDYAAIRACMTERMDAFVQKEGIEVKPGAAQLLDFLQEQQIPCALTTSSPIERVKEQLGRQGLVDKFSELCSAFLVEHGKPAPDIYLYGAKCLQLPPENCLAVEDSYTGLLSAYRAGTMNVLVPDLVPPDEQDRACAYAIADSLYDVLDAIRQSLG